MGFCQRVAVVSYLLLLLCHAALRDTEPSMPIWQPNISAVQYQPNKSLVVTVSPKISSIHSLKVCISLAVMCEGHVTTMESPNNTFRYSVINLTTNRSYYIYVKPLDANGEELEDEWIHKRDPVYLEPWPEERTSRSTTSDPRPEPEPAGEDSIIEVLIALLLVLIVAVVAIVCLWKKGYLHKIKFLRCCLPQSALVGPPTKVLQLYVVENEDFQQVVHKHMLFLKHYLNLDPSDCNEMRLQQNQSEWLHSACANSRVIVYVSPQLMHALRKSGGEGQGHCGEEAAHPHPLAKKYAQLIQRLASPEALKKARGKGRSPVLVLTGCFPDDADHERYLSESGSLRSLQRFWISRASSLVAPDPLLSKLSGCHHSFFFTRDWNSQAQSCRLQAAVNSLYGHMCEGHYYADLNGVPLAHFPPPRPGQVAEDQGSDVTEPEHVYSSVETGQGWQGRGPHRTDSGFSSSTTDAHRCSNHSWEGHSSPGGEGECGEEGVPAEREPMLHGLRHPLSVSQTLSFSFQPPESVVGGDTDSVVIDAELRKVNCAGECHWDHGANC